MSRSTAARLVLLGLLALSFACSTRLAPREVEAQEMDDLSYELAGEGLEAMRGYVAHLGAVSDPLRLHGTELCEEKIVPYLGLTLEIVGQGLTTPLDRVRRLRGIDVNPTVVSVIADSPAARGGLLPNDVIRSVNGHRVISYVDFLDRLKADADEAPRLEIKRAGERRDVVLAYRPACMPPAIFAPYGSLSTYPSIYPYSSRFAAQVVVTRGLMDFVRSDDELAILIAHEMAHEIIDQKPLTSDIEQRADRLSLELALRAGYDVGPAAEIWERLAVQRPWMIATHPEVENREGLPYHGDVAARTLRMPALIAELTGSGVSPAR